MLHKPTCMHTCSLSKAKAQLTHRELRTSVPGVWAAGDCCTVRAEAQEPQWFQMRLWTQVQPMQGRRQGSTCIPSMAKHLNLLLTQIVRCQDHHGVGGGLRVQMSSSCRPGQAGQRVRYMHIVRD